MMQPEKRIVVTGAAGFIGSYLAGVLNRRGLTRLVLVDDFTRADKEPNYLGKEYEALVPRDTFKQWIAKHGTSVQAVFHLGARTDTTEMDYEVHRILNLEWSKMVWAACVAHRIPLVYASSAATYGDGTAGYSDTHEGIEKLKPLNPYGVSKHQFDLWALAQNNAPPFWAGVKFFNVYGPNEYHKGRMASVILHAYRQIQETGGMKLFRSHRPDYTDGGQMRDFVYVEDVCDMITWLMDAQTASAIYNIGSGAARTFADLAAGVFAALSIDPKIIFVDTPEDIRDKYQYFTEADMTKLRAAGYTAVPHTLEAGITDYVQRYLTSSARF